MFKKTLGVIGFLVLSCTANAGLITDTVNDSFIDETTGLEWMDFGINNADTYNQVAAQLGLGGRYEGWTIATTDQTWLMLRNAFFGLGANLELENTTDLRVQDGRNEHGSVIQEIIEKMGYNKVSSEGRYYEKEYSSGLSMGNNGLTKVMINMYPDKLVQNSPSEDDVWMTTYEYSNYYNIDSSSFSTMLLRTYDSPVTDVPEPTTIAIFALGMFGLVSRKFKRNNL